jgi:alpha-tubulin suppressor-like RCC1 family protein
MGCACGKQTVIKSRKHSRKRHVPEPKQTRTKEDPSNPPQESSKSSNQESQGILSQQKDEIIPSSKVSSPKQSGPVKSYLKCGVIPLSLCNIYEFDHDIRFNCKNRSTWSEWQTLLKSHCNFSYSKPEDSIRESEHRHPGVYTNWDFKMLVEISSEILNLAPTEWVKDMLYLLNKRRRLGADRGGISVTRQYLQLQQHFRWFAWAVGAYFYVSMTGYGSEVGQDYGEFLGGAEFGLPKKVKKWFSGFFYKNAKFKLVFNKSDEGLVLKSERKCLKMVSLFSEAYKPDTPFELLPPMLTSVNLGHLTLYALPHYPQSVLNPKSGFSMHLFGKPDFVIPPSHIKELLITSEADSERGSHKSIDAAPSLIMIHNARELVPELKRPEFLVFLSCMGPEIKVYDMMDNKKSIPKESISKLLLTNKKHKNSSKDTLQTTTAVKFGWSCYIYHDTNPSLHFQNSIASLICGEIYGDVVMAAHYRPSSYKRFVISNCQEEDYIEIKKKGIRDTLSILEGTDNITNHSSLKHLLHRKGLNNRDEWIVLSKLRDERSVRLVETDILARAVVKWVWYEIYEEKNVSFDKYRELMVNTTKELLYPLHNPKPIYQPVLLMLFFMRLKSIKLAKDLRKLPDNSASRLFSINSKKKGSSLEYLLSHDILKNLSTAAARSPAFFITALEYHGRFTFKEEILYKVRCDDFNFLISDPVLRKEDIISLKLNVCSVLSLREDTYITLLKQIDQSNPALNPDDPLADSRISFVSDAETEMLHKEEERQSLELILPADLYSIPSGPFFKEKYGVVGVQMLQEWTQWIDLLLRDMVSVDGEEAVVMEIMIEYLTHSFFNDSEFAKHKEVIQKLDALLNASVHIPAEIVVAIYVWKAMIQERNVLAEAEQSYVTALMLMTKLYGDPRGRGNIGVPWQMLAAWKIGEIARQEERFLDAQAADEHFDSVYIGTKQFNQQISRMYKGKHSSLRPEDHASKYPFEHWTSTSLLRQKSLEPLHPDSIDDFCAWMIRTNLIHYSSGLLWNSLYIKNLIRNTVISSFPSQNSFSNQITSGTSTPTSHSQKESRRAMQQSSLIQVLVPENGAISSKDMRGVVYVWGRDTSGQLGLAFQEMNEVGDRIILYYPRLLTSLKNFIIREIAAGPEHCIAVTIEGRCYAWGSNQYNQLGISVDVPESVKYPMMLNTVENIIKAACAYQHSVLLSVDGRVFTMGSGEGILGHEKQTLAMYPKEIDKLRTVRIIAIECGAFHTVSISKEGHIYIWGRGDGGQLGLATDELNRYMKEQGVKSLEALLHSPARLYGELAKKRVVQAACGEAHTLCLTDEGEVYGWGWNSNGQLGLGISNETFEPGTGNESSTIITPTLVKTLEGIPIKHISAAGLYSMFLTRNNELIGCGMNDYGQIGIEQDRRLHNDIAVPTKLDCFSNIPMHNVVCGMNHTIAFTQEDERMVWSWGKYHEGQLGLGLLKSSRPRPIQSLTNSSIYRAACGSYHTMALLGNPTAAMPKRMRRTSESETLNWSIVYNKEAAN